MLIDIADAIINFYVLFVKRGRNIYEDMKKRKLFNIKLVEKVFHVGGFAYGTK